MTTFQVGYVDKKESAGAKGLLKTPCVLCRLHTGYDFAPGMRVSISQGKVAIPTASREAAHGITDPTLSKKQSDFVRADKGSFCVLLYPEHFEKFGINDQLNEEEPGAIADDEEGAS